MVKSKKKSREITLDRTIPWILFIGGLIGIIASLALCIEKFDSLSNPQYIPVCNLNPVLNCSTVSGSDQSQAFGFYNPFLGLVGFGAITALGVGYLAGAKYKRWFWKVINFGLLFAVGFITWLQFQSLYRIGALCIFCMVVWAVTIPMFWYATLYNIREGNIDLPKKLQKAGTFAQKHHGDVLILWFLIILGLILKRFWYYWSTLL